MAGRGPKPKDKSERRNEYREPTRGEWTPGVGWGWQHGEVPDAPEGMMPASIEAWNVWMRSWFAAHWEPEDLPGLRQVVRVYDEVERGDFVRAGELRLLMDTFGISPKGQQDRRWKKPEPEVVKEKRGSGAYAHLRAVND